MARRSREGHIVFLLIVGLLAWLVPGAGHLVLGKNRHAIVIFVTIALTLGAGLYIGSIGVIAQIPNIHRVLKKNDVDIEQLTAGKYKRTLTVLGENTDEGRQKMQEELEEVHDQFKDFVSSRRPKMDIEQVATGEHWLGQRAHELGLVDELQTSDDYLMAQSETASILQLKYTGHQTLVEKISSRMSMLIGKFEKHTKQDNYPKLM